MRVPLPVPALAAFAPAAPASAVLPDRLLLPRTQAQPRPESFSSVWLLRFFGKWRFGNYCRANNNDCIPPGPLRPRSCSGMPGLPGRAPGKTVVLLEREAADPYSRLAGL